MTCTYKLISKKNKKNREKNQKQQSKKEKISQPTPPSTRLSGGASRAGPCCYSSTAQGPEGRETFTLTSSGAEPPSLEEEGVATARMMTTTWPTARSPCQGSTWRSASASSPVLHTSRGHRVGCKPGHVIPGSASRACSATSGEVRDTPHQVSDSALLQLHLSM